MRVGKHLAAMLAPVAIAAVVGACGASPTPKPVIHNADDVAFAQNMIPHHQQAVDMSAMVPSRTANHDVIVLAAHISSDQQAEIEILQGLLAQWGEPVAPAHGSHGDHGGTAMEGMVDDDTMALLQALTGAEFDTLWLRSMISHHQGAVTMSQTEIARGQNADAVKQARIIVDVQQLEIARMNHLLTTPE
jgi:uncharacterized protein (DUF305 family)